MIRQVAQINSKRYFSVSSFQAASELTKHSKRPSSSTGIAGEKSNDAPKTLKLKALKQPAKRAVSANALYVIKYAAQCKEEGKSFKLSEAQAAFKELPELAKAELEQARQGQNTERTESYNAWVESLTVADIQAENAIRKQLQKARIAEGKKPSSKYDAIKDPRSPKRPLSAYMLFSADERTKSDYAGLRVPEVAKMAGEKWKSLTENVKSTYQEKALQAREQYEAAKKKYLGI